jgi:hypothetical protein
MSAAQHLTLPDDETAVEHACKDNPVVAKLQRAEAVNGRVEVKNESVVQFFLPC